MFIMTSLWLSCILLSNWYTVPLTDWKQDWTCTSWKMLLMIDVACKEERLPSVSERD